MEYYLAIWSLLFGLVIGSFLNVVVYRVPRHESLLHPGSHCPGCGAPIRWYDNIPVVSWLALGGRCRSCRRSISIRYPLIESLTGAAFLVVYLHLGPSASVLVAWAVVAVAITLVFIDHDTLVVPNTIVFAASVCGLAAMIALHPDRWWQYVAGCLGGALLTLLVAIFTPGVTRFSSAKMALFLGSVLGLYVLVAVIVAAVIGMFVRIALLFSEKYRLRARAVLVTPRPIGSTGARAR